jgi:hypothetical protein
MSAAAKLLDRLERVKQTGPDRWIAACPAHEDRRPSLSIREVNSGVLIYDFGGCETGDILGALGLTLSDLFDKPLAGTGPAGGFSPSRSRIPARDLLEIVSAEISVVCLVTADFLEKKVISETDWTRLAQASNRIHRAWDHING